MRWSNNLAYAVGLLATDGCLSNDGRHIDLTSKDLKQIENVVQILHLKSKITNKKSSYNPKGVYFRVQFSNVILYKFLLNVGLFPNKSLTIKSLNIPPKYFADFLRGHLDGDGNISVVKHFQSKYPQLRLRFSSASKDHLIWLLTCIRQYFEITGGFISNSPHRRTYYLCFSKADSIKILDIIYYDGVKYYLNRKYDYVQEILGRVAERYTRTA